MASIFKNFLRAGVCALALSAAATTVAQATEGYFVEGASARDQALAGAGMADPTEALTNANNPAGLVDVGHQLNMDVTAFMPWRGYSSNSNPQFSPLSPGSYNSYRNVFPIPALGYSLPTSPDSAWGVSMVGNGGMDTTFASHNGIAGCGVFYGGCAGGLARTGVDLNQALFSVGYARRFGNLSVGIAPVLSMQIFSAYGLSAFKGYSKYPGFVTDHSPSYSLGAGVRAGAIYHVNEQFSVAVAGSTPMWSEPFTNYHGLFAQSGSFDIPATIGAGVAYKIMPTLTAMLDYKHIFYSDVPSIANPLSNLFFGHPLGSGNGPGFGWQDVDVIALGVEWKYSDALTLRAGYAYSTQPITAANVLLNVLAPGVVTSHIGAGFSYFISQNSSVEFSALYSPTVTVSGPDPFSPPGSTIHIHLEELALTLGYNYHFGAPPAVVAKY